MSNVIPEQRCWVCDYRMDRTTHADGYERPKEGDTSLCFKCGEIGIFQKNLRVRPPTVKEKQAAESDPLVIEAQLVIRGHDTKRDSKI